MIEWKVQTVGSEWDILFEEMDSLWSFSTEVESVIYLLQTNWVYSVALFTSLEPRLGPVLLSFSRALDF